MWLDATALGADLLETGFPTVLGECRKHGIDPVTQFIPVAPGAHYSCGGILADLDGRTSVPGLYAVGEAASTGAQGANRLASNSVTEAIIACRRAGKVIATRVISQVSERIGGAPGDENALGGPAPVVRDDAGSASAAHDGNHGNGRHPLVFAMSRWAQVRQHSGIDVDAFAADSENLGDGRRALTTAMSRWAGVIRDRDGLTELARVIDATERAFAAGGVVATGSETSEGLGEAGPVPYADFDLGLEAVEAANLRVVSGVIAAGALRRAESRGCHRRRDAAGTAERPWHTLTRWDGRDLVVTEEEL